MRVWKSSFLTFVLAGCCVLLSTSPTNAHQTSFGGHFVQVVGGASPILLGEDSKARLFISAERGGVVSLMLIRATDAAGQKIDAANNTMRLEVVINGSPQTLDFPFTITSGRASIGGEKLGLVKPDRIAVVSAQLLDANGVAFGTLGARILDGP
jgi:hypothetical protein